MVSGKEVRVLVADDHTMFREGIRLLLETRGEFEVVGEAATGDEAVELTRSLRPDVVIMDIGMPGMNGLELQRKLVDEKIDLPIVFITGHGNVQMAVGAMQAGAVNFLEKPFHEQELWDSIRKALELDEQYRRRRKRRQRVEERFIRLTRGERQVLDLILDGKYNKEMAVELELSVRTIEDRRSRLMQKMEAGSVAELVQLAMTR
ncbi:hypothetical protein LCGC14_1769160 [marine sediment metagenome]|uniref:Response regulatory domain-containing protein n=1 Tax=marine sediment metagenome TaxID=412755 RepID=A0A0F9HLB4_9ZZZZ